MVGMRFSNDAGEGNTNVSDYVSDFSSSYSCFENYNSITLMKKDSHCNRFFLYKNLP